MTELMVGSVVTRFWKGGAGEGSESSDLRRIGIVVSVFDEKVETVRRAVGDEKRGCIDKKTDSLLSLQKGPQTYHTLALAQEGILWSS